MHPAMNNDVECCANCQWLVQTPKNNRYGDIENFAYAPDIFVLEFTRTEIKFDIIHQEEEN